MLNNKILFQIFIILSLTFVISLYLQLGKTKKSQKNAPIFSDLKDRQFAKVVLIPENSTPEGQEQISVEIVNTAESTTQGLSGRKEIGADGMLFIFPAKAQRYFWMKDMQFDLDLVWIADNKVVAITTNVPKPPENTPDNRLKTYPSEHEIDMVLEVTAGDAARLHIQTGDTIQLVE